MARHGSQSMLEETYGYPIAVEKIRWNPKAGTKASIQSADEDKWFECDEENNDDTGSVQYIGGHEGISEAAAEMPLLGLKKDATTRLPSIGKISRITV